MKLLSFSVLVVALLFACKPVQGQFGAVGCYLDGTDAYMGYIPVEIDMTCCTDTGNLFGYHQDDSHHNVHNADPYNELRHELESCSEHIATDSMRNCNADFTECTVDYHDYSCDDVVMKLCQERGGMVMEGSIVLQCSGYGHGSLAFHFLNKVTCMAKSCDGKDLLAAYNAMVFAMESEMPGVDCTVVTLGDSIIVDGRDIVNHSSTNNEDDNSTTAAGIATAIIVAVVVVLVLVAAIEYALHRRRRTNQEDPQTTVQMVPIDQESTYAFAQAIPLQKGTAVQANRPYYEEQGNGEMKKGAGGPEFIA